MGFGFALMFALDRGATNTLDGKTGLALIAERCLGMVCGHELVAIFGFCF